MRRHQQPQPSWRPGLDEVNGQKWHRLLQHCCRFIIYLYTWICTYASSHHSQIQKISTYFSSSLPKSAHRPRYEFVRVLTWVVSRCRLVDPTWKIRHEDQCRRASMVRCSFLCNCPTWYNCFWTLNPEMRGVLIQTFLFACYCKLLFFVLQHVWAWMPILHVIGVRRVKMVYAFCFTGWFFSSEASPQQEPNESGYWRPSAEHHRDHKATEPLVLRHVRTQWSHIVGTEQEF